MLLLLTEGSLLPWMEAAHVLHEKQEHVVRWRDMVEPGRYICILKFIYEIIKYIQVFALVPSYPS